MLLWVMILMQIVNGLKMSLAKQYFDDWLVFIKQQDFSFSRTEKKIQVVANTWRVFQLLEAVVSSVSGQVATFWLKDFVNTSFKNILEDNF